jgi:peptidoglycan hydrolase-like protein with peptidoglycan-binding domain
MLLILLGAPQMGFAAGDPVPAPPTMSTKEFGKKGSKSDITALQEILKYLEKDVEVNGKFDEKTKKALSDFRKDKSLPNSDGTGTFPAYVSTPVKEALYASWNDKQKKEAESKLASEKHMNAYWKDQGELMQER